MIAAPAPAPLDDDDDELDEDDELDDDVPASAVTHTLLWHVRGARQVPFAKQACPCAPCPDGVVELLGSSPTQAIQIEAAATSAPIPTTVFFTVVSLHDHRA